MRSDNEIVALPSTTIGKTCFKESLVKKQNKNSCILHNPYANHCHVTNLANQIDAYISSSV